MSSIALRQYVLEVGHSPFAHNYLVFYDDDGNIAGQFHGLAQDPKKDEFKEVGRSSDYLTVVPDDRQGLYREGQPEKTLWRGPYDEATARWQAARSVHDEINRRGLTYNFWGSDLNGPRDVDAPIPDVIAGNSNSVSRTLVEAMGLRLPGMPYMAPGIENRLLRQPEIDQILRKNGLPIPKGGLF
ncbi:hypothetical protein [Reyranella sp.]|uniref:hypothetical protein n=1 Tax=Reyranella sp. TaxID=1929291 RepID=UPI003BAB6F41